jgi:hypothetical protein
MRKQRGFIAALVALSILVSTAVIPFATKAASNFASVEQSLNVALAEKNFYYFNMAFERIMGLENEHERNVLLARLDSITKDVWTEEIGEIVENFVTIVNDKSGRVYDETQAKINKSALKEVDKQYLLHELNTWGKDTVWTADYIKAIDSIIKVWYDKTSADSDAAVAAIAELKLQVNQEYLTGLLEEAKVAVGLVNTDETATEDPVVEEQPTGEEGTEQTETGEPATDETASEDPVVEDTTSTEGTVVEDATANSSTEEAPVQDTTGEDAVAAGEGQTANSQDEITP